MGENNSKEEPKNGGGEVNSSCKKQRTRIDFSPDCEIIPTTRLCFDCCKDGKEHPIEHFLRYPCCGHYICCGCMSKKTTFCGECRTKIPSGNVHAKLWIINERKRTHSFCNDDSIYYHLLGRVMIYGTGTFLDELIWKPVYEYKKLQPPCLMLALMNPTNVQYGVELLKMAAEDEVISAMLDLADVYCTDFINDPFEKDKDKAEMWYVMALGKNNKLFPLAFTRYGDFLKWEQRFTEAKDMYEVAATYGHTRGQYEYSLCLLELSKTEGSSKFNDAINTQNMEDALHNLCKASEKGFYVPSYTTLAKVLIEIAERAYGTVFHVGKSPLPRVLQILNLAMDASSPRYGASEEWEDKTSKLLQSYEWTKKKCSNCGQEESEAHLLRLCGTCQSVAYCSKICQKRDYRDGHKFDCCSRQRLFDFEFLKYTLPWFSKKGWKREGVPLPRLSVRRERSLIDMVEDDTDEIYGEEDQDCDEAVLTNLMFRMRQNLETYLDQQLNTSSNGTLQKQIEKFSKSAQDYPECESFINAMDKIRTLGNNAVHKSSSEDKKLEQLECEQAVHEYRLEKEKCEKYRERACLHVTDDVSSSESSNVTSSNADPGIAANNQEETKSSSDSPSPILLITDTKIQSTPDVDQQVKSNSASNTAAALELKEMLGIDI